MAKFRKLNFVCGILLSSSIYFWRKDYRYFLPQIDKILISFYEIYKRKKFRKIFKESLYDNELKFPKHLKIYLDNGAFSFVKKGKENIRDYIEFVKKVKPYWYPIPIDYIPHPSEDEETQFEKFRKTMEMNKKYMDKGFIPVIHAGLFFEKFVEEIKKINPYPEKIAIGGLVPHMLLSKNGSRNVAIEVLKNLRKEFPETDIHVFGIGGITTIYLLKLAQVDSFDSIGWRVRAAWGIIQIKGYGERQIMLREKGWKVPPLSEEEEELLKRCKCPVCSRNLHNLMKEKSNEGFEARAIHNLYTLTEEIDYINTLESREYLLDYIDTTVKSSLIRKIIEKLTR